MAGNRLTSPVSHVKIFRLLDLPPELQLTLLELLDLRPKPTKICSGHVKTRLPKGLKSTALPPLLRVSRQIRQDILNTHYGKNTFSGNLTWRRKQTRIRQIFRLWFLCIPTSHLRMLRMTVVCSGNVKQRARRDASSYRGRGDPLTGELALPGGPPTYRIRLGVENETVHTGIADDIDQEDVMDET
ncbi:hypothetical protein LTR95_002540 [Oleoguttula sp. CCFEE 5521]